MLHVALSNGLFLTLAALAGATHVIAPDHWVPSSMLAWRRRWNAQETSAFYAFVLTSHVAAGFALYLVLHALFAETHSRHVFPATLVFVGLLSLLRMARFSRVRTLLHQTPKGLLWGTISIISVIGPAEALVPVLVRASEVHFSLFEPLIAFWLGTLASGLALIFIGPWIWDRPLLLPKGLAWAERRAAAIPIGAGVAIAATFLLR